MMPKHPFQFLTWLGIISFCFLSNPALAFNPLECTSDSDCSLGEACEDFKCVAVQCNTTKECPSGTCDCPHFGNSCIDIKCQVVEDGENDDLTISFCVENRKEGAACALDSECGPLRSCEKCECVCKDKPESCGKGEVFNETSCECECESDLDKDGVCDAIDKCDNSTPEDGPKPVEELAIQIPEDSSCQTDDQCNSEIKVSLYKVYLQDSNIQTSFSETANVKKVCEDCQCVSACSVKDCNDSNDCTEDSCNEASGECVNTPKENCPPPADNGTPTAEGKPTPNPCLTSFTGYGIGAQEANSLFAQGICSLTLQGQTARACSLVETGAPPNAWTMLLPLFAGTGWIGWVRNFRRGKK